MYHHDSICVNSGVATGWHGWTMSRGPRAKRAPRPETKKENGEREKKKKKEKRKGRTKPFKYPVRGPIT